MFLFVSDLFSLGWKIKKMQYEKEIKTHKIYNNNWNRTDLILDLAYYIEVP